MFKNINDKKLLYIIYTTVIIGFLLYNAGYVIGKFFYYLTN